MGHVFPENERTCGHPERCGHVSEHRVSAGGFEIKANSSGSSNPWVTSFRVRFTFELRRGHVFETPLLREEPERVAGIALRKKLGVHAATYNPATIDANRKLIQEVIDKLEKGVRREKGGLTTGGALSFTPTDVGKKLLVQEQMVASNKAKKAIQASLKATLGAAFTKEEGERVENRTFDLQLDTQANIDALKAELLKIDETRANTEGLFKQYKIPFGVGRSVPMRGELGARDKNAPIGPDSYTFKAKGKEKVMSKAELLKAVEGNPHFLSQAATMLGIDEKQLKRELGVK